MDLLNNKLIWFVHLSYEPPLPLCYRRIEDKSAEVIGGKTGSHRTGHSESYWDKLKELIGLGYIPAEIAKDLELLDLNWIPPKMDDIDNKIKEGYYRLKG